MQARREVLSWLGAVAKAGDALREELDRGPTFGELAHRWWQGVEEGRIARRKGRGGSGSSPNTLKGYERTLRTRLIPVRRAACQGGHRAKGAAGTGRRPPIAEPLREILRQASLRNPSEPTDPVAPTSVMSGKIARRATAAWAGAGLNRITLHECRHTYASFLMAAGYTLKEIMEYMGHSDLQMVQRYTKLLPQPEERDPAERLNAYLRRRKSTTG
jgi:integrase